MSKLTNTIKAIEYTLKDSDGKFVEMPLTLVRDIVIHLEEFEQVVNDDYERSELITHLLNGWLSDETIEFQRETYDDIGELTLTNFKVPRKWFEEVFRFGEITVTLTPGDIDLIYSNAYDDGVLIED